MKRQWFSLLIAVMVVVQLINVTPVLQQFVPNRVVYIYFPGSEGQLVAGIAREVFGNSTQVYTYPVEPDQSLEPLQFLYWITTGIKPSQASSIPLDAPYTQVNQSRIMILWSNTALINNPFTDPTVHPYAANPLFNASGKYIPPRIITVKANTSFYWDDIDSDVYVNLSRSTLYIEVVKQGYIWALNTSSSRDLAPPRIFILSNSTGKVSAGNYTVTFYVISANPENITLFFPGSMEIYSWRGVGVREGVTSYTVQWSMISRELSQMLPPDALAWWINQSIMTLDNVLNNAGLNPNITSFIVYIPQLSIAEDIASGNTLAELVNTTYEGFKSILSSISRWSGTTAIVVFDPGKAGKPGYITIIGGQEQGIDIELTSSQLVSYILASSSFTLIGSSNLLKAIADKVSEITNLSNKVTELNSTIASQNQTINDLNTQLAICNSEKSQLASRINEVDSELSRIQSIQMQVYTFITLGLATAVVTALALGLFSIHIARRKPVGE